MKKQKNKKFVNKCGEEYMFVRLPMNIEFKRELYKHCKAEGRSLNRLIVRLISEYLTQVNMHNDKYSMKEFINANTRI